MNPQMFRRHLRVGPRRRKSDVIRQGPLAEKRLQTRPPLLHPPRLKQLRMIPLPPLRLQSAEQNHLIRAKIFKPCFRHQRNQLRADRSLRWPKPSRLPSKNPLMSRLRLLQLRQRVLRCLQPLRQTHPRHRPPRHIRIHQQRQYRMIKRRRRQLHLPRIRQSPVLPQNPLQYLLMNLQHAALLLLREIPPLLDQLSQLGMLFPDCKPAPAQVEPDLQIPQILLPKPPHILIRLTRPRPPPPQIQQLPKPWIRIHTGRPVDLEEMLQHLMPLLRG